MRRVRPGAGALPLGPNLAAFIGHSDMRTAVMGLDRATRKDERPTRASRPRWSACSPRRSGRLRRDVVDAVALRQLDGDTCRSRTLPSTYAKPRSSPAEVVAAQGRTRSAVGSGHREPVEPGVTGGAVTRHLPQSAQDQPAVGGRRQVQSLRDRFDGSRVALGERFRQLPLAASSCRSRCTPTVSIW